MRRNTKNENLLRRLSPQAWMALGFISCILIGTCLLLLPVSSSGTRELGIVDMLFMATSATCVTGLSVIDVAKDLSFFGQLVILVMIQLGGLGITTLGTFLLVLVGRRLSIQNEFVLMDAYGVGEVQGVRSLLRWSFSFTLLFEGVGAALLTWRYLVISEAQGVVMPVSEAVYYAIFHAISAFCNAGFSLHPDSLIRFQGDPFYLPIIDVLIVLGGLGFLVLYNLATIKWWRRDLRARGRIALHTKIVVMATAALLVFGSAMIGIYEWNNTLSGMPLLQKINCAIFHGITPRTAGFNALPMSGLSEGSRYLTGMLMLIGGSPGSAAGGMKTTTLVVLGMTIFAMCRGRAETVIFSRTVTQAIVREAIVICLLTLLVIVVAYGILLSTETPIPLGAPEKLLFETISATATVGLSIDYTTNLTSWGRCVIVVCMYLGRLGPIVIAMLIGKDFIKQRIRYPEEEIVVG